MCVCMCVCVCVYVCVLEAVDIVSAALSLFPFSITAVGCFKPRHRENQG